MGISKEAKMLYLLGLWAGTLAVFALGLVFIPAWWAFRIAAIGMFTALGAACILLTFVPGPREYAAGLCSRCGYDLTLNQSGRCPECGKVIVAPPADAERS